MSNGLTPMGKVLDNQETFKLWARLDIERSEQIKHDNDKCFGVYTVNNRWMAKSYINSSGIILFNSEHDAIQYLDKWIASGKGYAKLLSPKYEVS